MQVQAAIIPFDHVDDFERGELSHSDYEMDLFTMSKKKPRPLYGVGINPKNPANAQSLYFI